MNYFFSRSAPRQNEQPHEEHIRLNYRAGIKQWMTLSEIDDGDDEAYRRQAIDPEFSWR